MVNKASYTNRRHAYLIFRSNIERNDLEIQKLKLAHAALSPPDTPPKSRSRKRKPAVALQSDRVIRQNRTKRADTAELGPDSQITL